jgi:hypothetical protein
MTAVLAAGHAPAYPLHLTAAPVPDRPSRGLWLVKWLLVIPHGIVLAFLWPAFFVLSVVAFFAILFSGRYPRAIFDFNVGVLRWSWRVAYYSYGALGTDRYPPFTLQDVPDYPAHLEADYPEHLSRKLVLVKWWLLALPHYLIVAVLTSSGVRLVDQAVANGVTVDGTLWVWQGGGLIALLAIVAGVALLFTGRYPQGLYDLLLGLNRWVLRVAAYAGLMTDTYPPFRLDQGAQVDLREASDGSASVPPPAPGPSEVASHGDSTRTSAPLSTPPPTSSWTLGRTVAVVAGALALVLGVGTVVAGAGIALLRDDGYLSSPAMVVRTDGYAVSSEPAQLWGLAVDDVLGQVRVRAEDTSGGEVFVGIARAADAAAYLDGVSRTVLTGPQGTVRTPGGGAPPMAPADSDIWVASSLGSGQQVVEVTAQTGTWVAVVMPADGSAGLEARVDVGATFPWAGPLGLTLLAVGSLLIVAGALGMAWATRAATAQA